LKSVYITLYEYASNVPQDEPDFLKVEDEEPWRASKFESTAEVGGEELD
jgi:hypothetical protein